MPKPEDEAPDFNEIELPGDGLPGDGLPGDGPAGDESSDMFAPLDEDSAPRFDEESLPEPEAEDLPKKKGRKKKEKKEKKAKVKKEKVKKERRPKKREEGEGKGSLLQALGQASPYTVMLGLALLAIVIAICCLLKELGQYDFEVKAERAKQAAMAPFDQLAPANTTETA